MNVATPNDRIVHADAVTKRFGKFTAVDGISLDIRRGECFGLLGPNGAGKSSFIRLLYGANRRTAGTMQVLGRDPETDARWIKGRLGVVTQEDALDEQMSVFENLRLYAGFLGLVRRDAAAALSRIDQLLEFMSLQVKRDAMIGTLSGGMRRRLVFVRALLASPQFIILDEPTTGLDPAVRQILWDKIRELRAGGTTILLTTHYMDEAEVLCDRIVIMDRGKICASGTPRELIARYCPGAVALFSQNSVSAGDAPRRVEASDMAGLLEKLAPWRERGIEPELLRPSTLEDVFLHITGRELGQDA